MCLEADYVPLMPSLDNLILSQRLMTIMKESPSSPSLFVNLIDTELNNKITRSSKKDPLVLNALQALEGEIPTQFRSQLSDESYDSGILAFQG